MLALLPMPQVLVSGLVDSRHSRFARVQPLQTLHDEARAARRLLLLAWLATALPAAVLALALHRSETTLAELGAGAALSGLLIALLTLQATAWSGLMPAFWLAAPLPLILWPLWRGFGGAWDDLIHLGPASLLAAWLALPLALAWLERCLDRPLRIAVGPAEREPRTRVTAALSDFNSRWRNVGRVDRAIGLGASLWFIGLLLFEYVMLMSQPWGGPVTGWYGLRILFVSMIVASMLKVYDLHWRLLLAPGGVVRRRLGSRIVVSTLAVIAISGMALALPALAIAHGALGVTWSHIAHWTAYNIPPPAIEIATAVALCTWLRGLRHRDVTMLAMIFGGPVLWFVAGLASGLHVIGKNPTLWTFSWWHAGAMLAAAMAFTLLANRSWARADLGTLFTQQPRSDADDIDPRRWRW
ncbi:MAG: hypothetical protein KGL18_15345 [Burkholderiales bacterium]|nr:hypothetical protein [Burkholderiales bacterium]MDE2159941.1 hypothetical protein [Burkholderiales bacterium]MDE2504336.1 hypothetical protein [Burkholderiales bacterium]